MREHGVIRRILVVYRLSAVRLRVAPASVPLDILQRAAKLMHSFGEEYHEKRLVQRIAAIENAFGLGRSSLTAPPPPKY